MRRSQAQGVHPSGALICQRCGCAASLISAHGPDWLRRRETRRLLCVECAKIDALVAERFALTLTLTSA
jgi:hypothetical protein